MMQESGGSMTWEDWRQAQNDLRAAQEAEDKAQERAINDLKSAKDTLYGVLNRTEHPVDISDQYPQHWRVYRQYCVTDLADDIIDAFDQCSHDLKADVESNYGSLRIDVYLPDRCENYNSLIDYKRVASILSMDYEIELVHPMARKLALVIQRETGLETLGEVEIMFNRL